MQNKDSNENDFLKTINEITLENISNERFGVSELADKIGMSRSNLLRKIKSLTGKSVSQFIREIRLEEAQSLLKEKSHTVSEIAFEVGFSSVSYFIKCFRDLYGFPPGELANQESEENATSSYKWINRRNKIIAISILVLFVIVISIIVYSNKKNDKEPLDKSIAVLPFKNDSDDSSNIYVVNGLMESILNNLQNIKDLRVISRTSVEKYRNSNKTIPEIAQELKVSYFVEGSGQKQGDKILLNIQLIDAKNDDHLFSKQYNKETKDIFSLQMEVAKNIAQEIKVYITPDEAKRIDKKPTNNLQAYDFYLQGRELLIQGKREKLEEAISFFNKAIEQDKDFALAYANAAITYFYLDLLKAEKSNINQLNEYAEKAFLLEPQLTESLMAKAMFYMNNKQVKLAIPYLEKALEYKPNSATVLNMLSDIYTTKEPNTEKYLEYALKGISIDQGSNDSISNSYTFLHISNAFIQTGFIEEAEKYIDISLEYNPNNIFSDYVKAYILFAKNRNLEQIKNRLKSTLEKDTSRLDVIQEVAKIHYCLRDYEGAYYYYDKFLDSKRRQNFDIFPFENSKIAFVYAQMGFIEEADSLINEFKRFVDMDNSIYKNLGLAGYYSYKNEADKAIKHLKLFSKEDNYHFWSAIFIDIDPFFDNIKNHPEFEVIKKQIEDKFWERHKKIKESLESKGVI